MKAKDYDGSQPLYLVDELHLRSTTEHMIQHATIKRARYLTWNVSWFSRGKNTQRDPGWPDLSMWRTADFAWLPFPIRQVLFIELKTHRGVVRSDQQNCLDHLGDYVPTFAIKLPKDILLLDYILEHGGNEGYATGDTTQERQA